MGKSSDLIMYSLRDRAKGFAQNFAQNLDRDKLGKAAAGAGALGVGAVGAAATEPQTFDPSKYSEDERSQGEVIVAGMRGYGPRAGESQESLQKALDNDAYTQDAMSSQEVTGEKVINAVARGAAMAGAAVALGMGANKLRRGKSPLDGFPGLKDLQKRSANEGVKKVDLNKVSDFDPVTGAREPTVAEYNVINKGASSPSRSQQELSEYLEKPLGKMGTPQQRPADSALESYVEGRRAQQDPVDRLSAELEGDFQAQRVREVKEELGGQVLEELQREGRASDSFAQGYVRKEGYVDSSPVQTQSTDSMDIDGYQEHREVKRVLQRNEDLDIGSITAKTEPNFGAANPEQVDNSSERLAARVQEAPIVERTGGGFNQETTLDQMQQNVEPQGFAKEYVTKLTSAADNPKVQPDFDKGRYSAATGAEAEGRRIARQERFDEAADDITLREGKAPAPDLLEDKGIRSVENIGSPNIDPQALSDDVVRSAASNTSIRGRSRVQNEAEQFTDRGEYVMDQTDRGGMGIYGIAAGKDNPVPANREIASGPINKMEGGYTRTAERVPSLVYEKQKYPEARTPSGKQFTYPVMEEGAKPAQIRKGSEFAAMDDTTLQRVSQETPRGTQGQKLQAEVSRRAAAPKSVEASARIMEINRSNPPEQANKLVQDYLKQLRGGV